MWATIILKPAITISAWEREREKKSLKIVFYIYTQIQTAYTLARLERALYNRRHRIEEVGFPHCCVKERALKSRGGEKKPPVQDLPSARESPKLNVV